MRNPQIKEHARKFRVEWMILTVALLIAAGGFTAKRELVGRSAPEPLVRQAISDIGDMKDTVNTQLQVSRTEFEALRAQVDSLKSLVLWIGGQ